MEKKQEHLDIAKQINFFNNNYTDVINYVMDDMLDINKQTRKYKHNYYLIDFNVTSAITNYNKLKLIDKTKLNNLFEELRHNTTELNKLFSIEIGFQSSAFMIVSKIENNKSARLSEIKMF